IIYGITPPADLATSRRVTLLNRGPDTIILPHDSGSATSVTARFRFPGNLPVTLVPNAPATFDWSVSLQRWPPVGDLGLNGYVPPGSAAYLPEVSSPGTPVSGYGVTWVDVATAHLKFTNSAGTTFDLSAPSGTISGLTTGRVPKAASATS